MYGGVEADVDESHSGEGTESDEAEGENDLGATMSNGSHAEKNFQPSNLSEESSDENQVLFCMKMRVNCIMCLMLKLFFF